MDIGVVDTKKIQSASKTQCILYFLKARGSRNSNMTSGEGKDMDMDMVDISERT